MQEQSKNIGAPIPGMSFTAELGSRPWQQPPKYSKVEDAIEYYIDRLSSEEASEQIIEILEGGVPVTKLANIIQLGSVMEGLHTIDVGMLASPVIIEFIQLIGDSNDVDYRSGLDDMDETTKKRLTAKAMREFKKELQEKEDTPEQTMVAPMMEEMPQEPMPEPSGNEPSGLMSRRTA